MIKRLFFIVIAILTAFLCIYSSTGISRAELQWEQKKVWAFQADPGVVKLVLHVRPDGVQLSTLDILYERGAQPSVSDEAKFLSTALQQFGEIGVDQHSLAAISMRGIAEPDVRRRIAVAALHSRAWHSRGKIIGGAERVVQDLMNSTGAYDAFDKALAQYDLKVRVAGVEKVAVAPCSDLEISDPACTRSNALVPVGGNLRLEIVKAH